MTLVSNDTDGHDEHDGNDDHNEHDDNNTNNFYPKACKWLFQDPKKDKVIMVIMVTSIRTQISNQNLQNALLFS